MIHFSFGNSAFNCGSSESTTEMTVAPKAIYENPEQFLRAAVAFMDEKVNPGYGIKEEYEGARLKAGQYTDIVKNWLATMNEKVEVCIDEIQKAWRIKKVQPDPISDEFVLETADEYILFLWTTSA